MSLRFTRVTYIMKNGSFFSDFFPGHPDEETLRNDPYFAESLNALAEVGTVGVQHYRFLSGPSDEDAGGSHFALMKAYDELAEEYDAEPFAERDDVEHLDYFSFRVESEVPHG